MPERRKEREPQGQQLQQGQQTQQQPQPQQQQPQGQQSQQSQEQPLTKDAFLATPQGQAVVNQYKANMIQEQRMQQQAEFEASEHGRLGKIGEEQIRKAKQILEEYHVGKKNLEARIISNEQYWKQKHWEQFRNPNNKDPEPTSAWLVNMVINKHADFMDNEPEANILAKEASDREDAKVLSDVIPVVMEQAQFNKAYSDVSWYKLIKGTGVYGVFWNPRKNFGRGDIDVKKMDLLNIFWQPGIQDIQDSRNLFIVSLVDNEVLEEKHEFLRGRLINGTAATTIQQYRFDDTVKTDEKSLLVDWYYKVWNGTKEVLHYCQFVNENVIYASENDVYRRESGFYGHGKYPLVYDVLFPEEGSPAGFGYVDIAKDPQMYIDKLNQAILKNAVIAAKPRYFIKNTAALQEEEFADLTKDFVHVNSGNLDETNIRPIAVNPLSSVYVEILNNKIEELKETSGNRDVSNGGITGGATAASAIAAMQEAGSKASRDAIKSSYRAYEEICYMILELIREFYDEPREFRIIGEMGTEKYITFTNQTMKPQKQYVAGVDMGSRMPMYDIKVIAQKKSAFSRIAQNELAKEMYGLGAFNPAQADQIITMLEMMDFEGKDIIEQKISENGLMYQRLQSLMQTALKLAQIVDQTQGTDITAQLAAEMGMQTNQAQPTQTSGGSTDTNALGDVVSRTGRTTADTARERAQNVASVK